jgi:membrane protein
MREQLSRIGRRFVKDIQRDDASGISAELAYRFLFAIFPFGIFVAALTAFVAEWVGIDDPTGKIIGGLSDNLPPDIANAIAPQIEAVIGTTRPGLLTFGALLALWSASSGTNALIKAMNRAYEVEETRALVPRYALAIGLTLLATIGILIAFVTVIGASLLTEEVTRRLGLNQQTVELIARRWHAHGNRQTHKQCGSGHDGRFHRARVVSARRGRRERPRCARIAAGRPWSRRAQR